MIARMLFNEGDQVFDSTGLWLPMKPCPSVFGFCLVEKTICETDQSTRNAPKVMFRNMNFCLALIEETNS